MRLATRIAIWAAVLLPLLVLGTSALLLGLVSHDLRNEQDAKLRDRAQLELPYVRAYLNADHAGRTRVEQNQHQKVLGAALDVGIEVADASGAQLLAEGRLPAAAALPPATTDAAGPVTVRAGGQAWRVLARPVTGADPGTLWVAVPASATAAQVSAVRGRIVLVTLLAAPLAGLLAYGLARRATAPLSRLGRRAAALDPQAGAAGFDHRHSGIGEVDELAAALAGALARYDEQAARTAGALETARSFSAAASHELRTPLMGLQTNLDVLAAHPDLPPAERAEILADLRNDHRRMLDLLTALRMLARGDLVEQEAFGPLDPADQITAAVAELRRRCPELEIMTDLPEAAGPGGAPRVFGWEAGLRIVCDNLLANAAVHGRQPGRPGRIAVALRQEADQVVLTVDDAGPGIPQAERAAVFDRFHRRRDSPGSGLGLTLVAQQVALHRGAVRVATPPSGSGCRIEVRLPLLASPDAPTLPLPARRDWIGATG
ncbi:HAMP domain-containing histidine kinase [Kitasatospora sp. NBC_01250]|uniref:sensor histidine kinase n=1 Tax=unclassified Kitasatospora TaxID=2633591 RepID=UPI002E167B54|nr:MULTISPECIES: HAMP domain-containing sensor histidine kinase [unclassified Kitasatospora]WSJ66350.1 HAMP domain-containing histidine kinase [Kitasatospora sp. NBC_01302]